MRISVTTADIQENPVCPIEPALQRLTGEKWLVGIHCAERAIEVEEDGEVTVKTAIIEMPEAISDYIAEAAAGKPVQAVEFEVGEPIILE